MMELRKIVQKLNLEVSCGEKKIDSIEISRGYASDLLSDVLANSDEGDIWITLQTHQNIVAVASMKGIGAILLINGRNPHEETIEKADEEGIPILVSSLPAFELIGQLCEMGIRGIKES